VSQVRSRIEKIGCKATVHELESHELGLLGRQSVRELSDGLAISVVDERATLDALVQVRPLLRPEKRGERWTHTSRSRATTIYPSLQGERRDNCSYLLNTLRRLRVSLPRQRNDHVDLMKLEQLNGEKGASPGRR
jgi:hypothetical protein